MREAWPWATAAFLGAFHGVNPAMGWLFAVALGMQERSRATVLLALVPITIGHALSVVAVALVLRLGQATIPWRELRIAAAFLLIGFGLLRLVRPYLHPRWVGMRVNFGDLVLWSFLMASAHGAGLMLAPVLLHLPRAYPSPQSAMIAGWEIIGIHTLALLLVMGAVALAVYQTAGLGLLRRAWINIDLLWAGALVVAGGATLLLPT